MKPHSKLLSPFDLGPLTLPNRIIMPAMDPSLANPDGSLEARSFEHYRRRAQGGVGLIITGNMACELRGRVSPWMPLISDDRFLFGLERLATEVHTEGGRIFFQISHAGRQTLAHHAGEVVSASALPCPLLKSHPRALESEEVEALAERFAQAVERAKRAGADGVELHMAHGYLIAQFLSPYSNKREDRWGEGIKTAFAEEILRRSRARVGPEWPIQCRISADEFVPGGIEIELAKQQAQALEAAGATSISVSACNYESYHLNMPACYLPRGTFAPLAAKIRGALKIPVVAVGRFDPGSAEAALKAGQADLIALGRALLADPDLPQHLSAGNADRVRPCLACNRCAEAVGRGAICCTNNPELGLKSQSPPLPAQPPGSIAVIGGGPAGLNAATELARRGHQVQLWDPMPGGKLWQAARPPKKKIYADYARWLIQEATRAGVEIRRQRVEQAPEADLCVWATGAEPAPPPQIPGLEEQVGRRTVESFLSDPGQAEHLLIIGGGAEGAELADAAAQVEGIKRISVVERRPKIGLGLPSSLRRLLLQRLQEAEVKLYTRRQVGRLSPEGVELVDHRGRSKEYLPPIDQLIFAIGAQFAKALELHSLGDCREPGRILEAVRDGWRWGRSLESGLFKIAALCQDAETSKETPMLTTDKFLEILRTRYDHRSAEVVFNRLCKEKNLKSKGPFDEKAVDRFIDGLMDFEARVAEVPTLLREALANKASAPASTVK